MESNSLRINQRVELRIEGVGAGGEGIGRLERRAVFVPRTLPQERVRARIVHIGSKKIAAEPQKILEPSPDRRDPVCPVFGRCGGCQLMHAGYPAQLELKKTILKDALSSIAGIRLESIPVAGAQQPLYYRNRGQYPVARAPDGVDHRVDGHGVQRIGHRNAGSSRFVDKRENSMLLQELERQSPGYFSANGRSGNLRPIRNLPLLGQSRSHVPFAHLPPLDENLPDPRLGRLLFLEGQSGVEITSGK